MLPYKPDGLTAEEWERIKARDRAETAGKDFGAWGPRFQRTEAPFWASAGFLSKSGALVGRTDGADSGNSWLWQRFRRTRLAAWLYAGGDRRADRVKLAALAILGS